MRKAVAMNWKNSGVMRELQLVAVEQSRTGTNGFTSTCVVSKDMPFELIKFGKRAAECGHQAHTRQEGEQMLAAQAKTHCHPRWPKPGIRRRLSWNAGSWMVATSVTDWQTRRVINLPVKRRQAGNRYRLPFPIRWFACWSQKSVPGVGHHRNHPYRGDSV